MPVLTALVQNYLTFNHCHSDHPGVSLNIPLSEFGPSRDSLICQPTNTVGHGANDDAFGSGMHGLTQRSIFQQLSETNHTWKNYYTNTDVVDSYFFDWTFTSGNTDLA